MDTPGTSGAPWTAGMLAQALVDLLEEPFATPEDVGLDVRRVETAARPDDVGPGRGRVATVELDLADGTRFRLAVERLA
ncbi:hypothetical protein ACXR2U_04875 [Jatrophihabitans sp. YIM 134969]